MDSRKGLDYRGTPGLTTSICSYLALTILYLNYARACILLKFLQRNYIDEYIKTISYYIKLPSTQDTQRMPNCIKKFNTK